MTVVKVLTIVATAVWVYWPALHGSWLWDDDVLVTDNSDLRSLQGLWEIWSTVPATDYWPLTWTLLWVEWHFWGNAPFGYHLCSLALHIFSGFLIWRVFGRLGLRYGWLGGFFFVIHPLAVESVAWVSEIKNTLSLPLFLLSFNAWLDAEEKKPCAYSRSVFYYLAAMLAKTSTIMLPSVLLLYCWWKRGRVTRQELRRLVPYFAIAMVLGLATIFFQNLGQKYSPLAFALGGFIARLIDAGMALLFYLEKFILPINLLPVYPRWSLNPPSMLLEALAISTLAGSLSYSWARRHSWGRHALFGFGFFLLNALPVLGLVKMQYMNISLVADHLTYLPTIGLIGLVVAGLEKLKVQLSSSPHLVGIGAMSTVFVAGLLLRQGHDHAMLFNNGESLWTYTLQHNPQAAPAHNNLGLALLQTGRVPEAIEQFELALQVNPDNAYAHKNLGTALLQTGRVPEAIDQFELALKIEPNFVAAHNNLGATLVQTGRAPEAIEQFKQSLKIKPDSAIAHNNLGGALLQMGRVPEAIEQFKQALKIEPDFAAARYNLVKAQARLKSNNPAQN
jgi:tetratricopeptide (TPR) repeat protein